METDKTSLGDRLKTYEQRCNERAFKGEPLIARLDGKAFHTFCKGLKRPYDERLSQLMVETTSSLVDVFQPDIGYTQSDEITLAWHIDVDSPKELPFSGRFQKLESLLAAHCSVHFNSWLERFLPEKAGMRPIFDCRVFSVPNLQEAYHCFLWRQQDATKNAIQMAAQSFFSHRDLQHKHGAEMQEMLFAGPGINFNDYPAFFKRGTFVRRVEEERALTSEDYERIPPRFIPESGFITRTVIRPIDIWLSKQRDPLSVLFRGAPADPA